MTRTRPPKFRWIARREDVESERDGRVRAGIRTEISAPTEPIRGCTHAARRAAYFDKPFVMAMEAQECRADWRARAPQHERKERERWHLEIVKRK